LERKGKHRKVVFKGRWGRGGGRLPDKFPRELTVLSYKVVLPGRWGILSGTE
jgi:hypothetical protein